jgi:WD40 repeat protein
MNRFWFAVAALTVPAVLAGGNPPVPDPEPIPGDMVNGVTYSPDKKWLVVAETDNNISFGHKQNEDRVTIYDAATFKAVRTYTGPEHVCRPIHFSPDGKTVYCAGKDGAIYALDFETWKIKKKEPADSWMYVRIWVSPDGKWLISSHGENRVNHPRLGQSRLAVWEAATLKHVRDFPEEPKLSTGFTFAPDRKTVATTYYVKDGVLVQEVGIIELDLTSGKEVRRFAVPTIALDAHSAPGHLIYAPDGNRLFMSGGDVIRAGPNSFRSVGYVRVWDRTTGKVTRMPPHDPNESFGAVTLSADGKRLYAGSGGYVERSDGRARWKASRVVCWDTTTWEELWATDGEHGRVYQLLFSPSGDRVVAGDDGGLWLFDAKTGTARGGLIQRRRD